ncbi:MAG: UDP-N-acetylmuramoyl-L-alanyl-D-glutamate--2,6-diaminopimelate ligase [Parvularculales bacterium]
MTLRGLVNTDDSVVASLAEKTITGLTADSREVQPGWLFAALPGEHNNGLQFIGEAIGRGASAILAPLDTHLPEDATKVALIIDDNPRRRLSLMAARFYESQPDVVVAVTGTNGKTSVVSFVNALWRALGITGASIGTLGVEGGMEGASKPTLTTPDSVSMHRMLSRLARAGVSHVALEASSHGLAQYRLDGVRLAAAVFTNLSRDHMDYHGDVSSYKNSKLRLFNELLPKGGLAVLNGAVDDYPDFDSLCRKRGHRILTVGGKGGSFYLADVDPYSEGQRLTLIYEGQCYRANLPLVGEFQAINALMAAALVIGLGVDPALVFEALSTLESVPGRMEEVGRTTENAPVYVDYAHTPDALSHVLRAVRAHVGGQLLLVFGCGGDRDRGKRAEMGEVASRLADKVWVTDDNPRTEDAAAIRAAVLAACPDADERDDRAIAIAEAIRALTPHDALIIAGKGHETGQVIGDQVIEFCDREVARSVLVGAKP